MWFFLLFIYYSMLSKFSFIVLHDLSKLDCSSSLSGTLDTSPPMVKKYNFLTIKKTTMWFFLLFIYYSMLSKFSFIVLHDLSKLDCSSSLSGTLTTLVQPSLFIIAGTPI